MAEFALVEGICTLCLSMAEFALVEGAELPESEAWLKRRVDTGIRDCEFDLGRVLMVGAVCRLTWLIVIPMFGPDISEVIVVVVEGFVANSLRDLR